MSSLPDPIEVDPSYQTTLPPPASSAEQNDESKTDQQTQTTESQPRPPPLTRASTAGVDKCWICLSTKDEDDPQDPPVWRHPCKCTLSAHESCLLDWVADQENPKNRRSHGGPPDQILCPQCKSEIKVSRPTNPIVTAARKVDRAYSRLILPSLGLSFFGTIFMGCWAHGRAAMYLVFGPSQYHQILGYARAHPGYDAMHAMIPLTLIFSRTRYSEFVTPASTMFLLYTQLEDGNPMELDWTTWPPLPSTVFACLPVVRQFYNWSYEKMFGDLNRKWIAAVQPRREEGYEGQDQNIADILNEQEQDLAEDEDGATGVVLELELNLGGGGGGDEDDGIAAANAAAAADENGQGANEGGEHNGMGDGANGAAAGARPAGQRVHQLLGDNELMDDTSSIGQMVIGALAMPVVSAGMGSLLDLVLPASLTSPFKNFAYGRSGLLASQWGRAVVGGCLFVALKDALVLYCRWRLAMSHKQRRIMDFDKVKKEYRID